MGAGSIAGKMTKGALRTVAVVSPLYGFKHRMDRGEGLVPSLAKTIVEEAAFAVAPGLMFAGMMAPVLAEAAHSTGQYGGQARSSMHKANFGGNFVDTQGAYTMRQRGVQAIQQTGMNTRSILGSEARRGRF